MRKTINKAFFTHAYKQYIANDMPILYDQQKSLEVQADCLANLVTQAQPGFDPQKKLPHLRDDRKIAEWLEIQGCILK